MAKYKLLLPKMGESVAEATIIKWNKKPGDYVEADEAVMEIATDKVDSDVPSPVSGTLVEQLFKENDVVQVGAVIAIIETGEPEEVTAPAVVTPAVQPVSEAPVIKQEESPATPEAAAVQNTSPLPAVPKQEEKAPATAGESYVAPVERTPAPEEPAKTTPEPPPAQEPTEAKPYVFAEQQRALTEQVPYTAQAEQKSEDKPEGAVKSSSRFYSPLVKNIAAQEGIGNDELDQIPGTGAEGRLTKDDLLSYIQNKYQAQANPVVQAETPAAESFQPAEASNESQPQTGTPISETFEEPPAPQPVTEAFEQEPVADTSATEHPATETAQATSEPVIDVPQPLPVAEAPKPEPVKPEPIAETAAPEPVRPEPVAPAPAPKPGKPEPAPVSASLSGGDEIIEMDRMRRLIADHMVMSVNTSPHVTSFVEADVTNLVRWREKIKNDFEKREGEKITFTPIFIEAVVRAIKDMPMINVQVNGTQIIKKKDINISMATSLPSGNLIVPVIKRADELSLIGLTKAVNDLANRARTNKLKPDDVQGGTFTITNVGTFGNVMGTPIINQPQVAILAVGAIRKKPAVIETLQGDMIGIRHMMFLSLSYDHRVVDGALGGSFVRRVADYLENWDPGREI